MLAKLHDFGYDIVTKMHAHIRRDQQGNHIHYCDNESQQRLNPYPAGHNTESTTLTLSRATAHYCATATCTNDHCIHVFR